MQMGPPNGMEQGMKKESCWAQASPPHAAENSEESENSEFKSDLPGHYKGQRQNTF